MPLACGIALFAFLERPVVGRRSTRFLDSALAACLVAIALQLIPLPAGLRSRVTPAAVVYDRALRVGTATGNDRPLSIDPAATLLALIVVAALVLLFWSARAMFHRRGIRATIRAVAWIGLFISPLAIIQHLMPLPVVDFAWGVTSRGLRSYGPFVNRNDFAGWLIMVIPLTLGYAVARMQSRHRAGEPFDTQIAVDSKSIWLGMAICMMLAGLLFSLSRSGLLGAFVGLVSFAVISRRRLTAKRAGLAIGGLGAALAVASAYADMGALSTRFGGSLSEGLASRLSIWRQTWPVVRDFWPAGAGVGTYQAVMVLYQTMSRFFYISHADNEFLQILAEGGLLFGVPVLMAIVAGMGLVAKRLREDHTAIFWLRAGAAAGMLALATQNMVEMTLRVPANSILFAILAAVATSESAPATHRHK